MLVLTITIQKNYKQHKYKCGSKYYNSRFNGTSRYVIMNPESFGKDRQYNYTAETNDGRATAGTSTTLTDSTKLGK
jgi:hypothetical protein